MRRKPVYVLIDTSRHMAGEPLSVVKTIINGYVEKLCNDPFGIESVHLSIVSYGNGRATLVIPLTGVASVEPDRIDNLSAAGERLLGDGLLLLEERYTNDFRTTTAESKGDWKAQLFVFIGGQSSDPVYVHHEFLKRCFAAKEYVSDTWPEFESNHRQLFTFNKKVSDSYRTLFPDPFLIEPRATENVIETMYQCHKVIS